MFDQLIRLIAPLIAEQIVDMGVALRGSHQESRDQGTLIAEQTRAFAAALVDGTLGEARNRYREWENHPRLGHESLCTELKSAEVSAQREMVRFVTDPSLLNKALALAAGIRLSAIIDVLGPECIARVRSPVADKQARAVKRGRKMLDRRKSRRALVLGDLPSEARPHVAKLGRDGAEHAPVQ